MAIIELKRKLKRYKFNYNVLEPKEPNPFIKKKIVKERKS